MRIDAWLAQAREQLAALGDSARLDAELLLAGALQKDRTWLYTWADRELSSAEQALVEPLLQRRCAGEPVAYILGWRDFWSLRLQTEPSTLIPRPDTETLIEWALELPLPANSRVLDLGTGTGAISWRWPVNNRRGRSVGWINPPPPWRWRNATHWRMVCQESVFRLLTGSARCRGCLI